MGWNAILADESLFFMSVVVKRNFIDFSHIALLETGFYDNVQKL